MDEEEEARRFNYVNNLLGCDSHELNEHYELILDEMRAAPEDAEMCEILCLVERIGPFLHGDDFILQDHGFPRKSETKKLKLVVDNTV